MMDRERIRAVKKSIRIEKYNHIHDERGRFASKESAGSFAYLDGLKISDEEKSRYKSWMKKEVEKAKSFDGRLQIDEEKAYQEMDRIAFKDIQCYGSLDDHVFSKVVDYHKSLINGAIYDYSAKDLGVEFDDTLGDNVDKKAIVDFVEGASWVRKNLGSNDMVDKFSFAERNDDSYYASYVQYQQGNCRKQFKLAREPYSYDEYSTKDALSMLNITEKGLHPKGFCAKQIGAHEYAHAFADSIKEKMKQEGKSVADGAVESEILRKAINGDESSLEDRASEVSEYALYNVSECFAECIADYYTNGDNAAELSKAVFKVATEQMDDVCSTLKGRI